MKLTEILKQIKHTETIGNIDLSIDSISSLSDFVENGNTLTWANDKNLEKLIGFSSGIFICGNLIKQQPFNANCTFIISDNPRSTFRELLVLFSVEETRSFINSKNQHIESTVILGSNIQLGNNVVIEHNCYIGNNVKIGHNTVLMRNTIIKDNVIIGSNNTIGGVGFGYEKNEEGLYEVLPHIGNVILEEGVEIGNNTCIDRAVVGSTILKKNVKVDNLVHVAHGVKVGENSLLIANSMIGGSVKIGENCWIAPSSSIKNQVVIKDNVLIGMAAVVLKNVESNEVIIGNPGKPLTK